MDKYKTMADFGGVGAIPVMKAVVTAVPIFFPFIYFVIWIFAAGGSYYVILKKTGKKRIFHTFTASSFVCFLLSLLTAAMNDATTTFISGYWVGFYILATVIFFILLSNYK